MDMTYVKQREDINNMNCILNDIIVNWPYFFKESHFLDHFNRLVGKDIKQTLSCNFASEIL